MLTIAWFEFRARLRLASTWLYFALYALISGLWMAAAGGAIEGASVSFGSEKIFINSPYALAQALTILGFIGVTVIAAMMGRAMQQDFEHGTFHFFFSAPIRKRDYFFGRFIGAYLALIVIFLGLIVGLEIGAHWPGVDAARLAPFSAQALLRPLLFTLLPNMLWLGGVFFVLAALTRQIAPVYIAGVVVLVGYLLAISLLQDMENRRLSALVDPIGSAALSVLTRYWSVAERNSKQIPLTDVLLWNRAIWIGFGVLVIALGYRLFKMEVGNAGGTQRSNKATTETPAKSATIVLPATTPDHRARSYLRMLPSLTALYLRETLKRPRFLAVVLAGALFVIGNAQDLGNIYGTNAWPVTYLVLEATSNLFALFMLIVTAINAGELIWRERDARIDEISDSTPAPLWLSFSAKLATLFSLQALLLGVVMLCSIGIQWWQHYTKLELTHYLFDLYLLQLPGYWIIAALAIAIHVVVNQKYLGHFLVVLYYVTLFKLPDFGFEDRLYLYGSTPDLMYSDINHYGHFLPAVRWFQLYWGAAAVLVLVAANLLWLRGRETHWRRRLQSARQRFGRSQFAVSAVALLLFVGSGAWIFYNTHVLNPFRSKYDSQKLQAEYEQHYKRFDFAPQPHITAVDLNVDLYPQAHRADIRGHYKILNRSDQPINDLYVLVPDRTQWRNVVCDIPLTLVDSNPPLYWWHYRLARPLAPGESVGFSFELGFAPQGFGNNGASKTVLDNGSFLNAAIGTDAAHLPDFGYSEDLELESDRDRKKFGLPPKERMHDLDDQRAQQYAVDWLDHYNATLSTDADQLAITSGYLDKSWIEGDRHFYRYAMDSKMMNLVPFLSARYAVRKDHWSNGQQDVDLEIDYQPGHEFNLDRMFAASKDSLDYFSKNFGPYQHRILRIVEFPRYERFAESFPNTVPFSEAIGFIAKVDDNDPKDIDYAYFVTAHEIAHQWWGHQAAPAAVQGGPFLSESLAEYSALLVLKHKYGDAKMRRFLKYELDRYLRGRGTESKKEQPLLRADGATYVHYQKGSLAFYALQDAIGEDTVNRALRAYVDRWKFQGPPFPTSRDLLAELKKVTPPEQQSLLTDLFETITLYDNRATQATYRELDNGKFEVDVSVNARKLRADGSGAETEVPMDDSIDIGVLGENDEALLLQKQRVVSGSSSYKLIVDKRPLKAGIDPLNKLIDRIASDNVIAVTKAP